MGHRTLVAYEREGYDLHYAHWGVDPAALTPLTPYGGRPDADRIRAAATADIDPAGGRLLRNHGTAVDPDPVATVRTFDGLLARIDPVEHEALYVVTPEFAVRRYLVVALGTAPGRRRTAVVRYRDAADARYLRGWLAGARAVRDVAGTVSPAPVAAALRGLDPARGTVVYPAGPSGGRDGRR
jgi:hypothetical protein